MKNSTFIKSTFMLFVVGLVMLTNFNVNAGIGTKNNLGIGSANPVSEGLEAAVDAPTAKAATKIGHTLFQANWSAVKGTGYILYVYTNGKGGPDYVTGYNPKAVAGSSTTKATVSGLKMNTTYYFVLKTVGSTGTQSDLSNVISVKTLNTAPAAPVATAATNITATSFTANWEASDGASEYSISIIGGTPGVIGLHNPVAGYDGKTVTGTSFDLPEGTLIQGVDYYYSLKASNAVGESDKSNNISVKTVSMTYVPDDNFEQALIDKGYDTAPLDDYVPTANINSLTSLDVSNKSIANLTGIEDFTALTELVCSYNELTSLNVSANTALTDLYCSDNELTSLDVSSNLALTKLHCSFNLQLTSLDVSANTALTKLNCYYTQLSSLDVSTNIALTELQCYQTYFTSLDVSANTALTLLYCQYNDITTLDVSANTALTTLICSDNQLTSLDVSANTALIKLYCDGNQLTSLNLKNGNNSNMLENVIGENTYTGMDATGNPNLTCIEVDDQAAVNDTYGWLKDATASYSLYCGVPAAPVILEATDITATSFTANWEAAEGATSYKLSVLTYPGKNYVDGYNKKSLEGLGTSFILPGNTLEPGKGYSFRVCAVNAAGVSDWSYNMGVTTVSQYTLTLSASPAVGGVASGGESVVAGTSVTAQATANDGYVFENWTELGTEVSTNATYSFILNDDRTLVANFAAVVTNNTLSLSATPAEGGTVSGGATVNAGTSVTAQASANADYVFVNWTENGTEVSIEASYTFTLTEDRTLVANFAAVVTNNTLSLSATQAEGGTVRGGATVNAGTSVTAQASANADYVFVNWTENGTEVSTEASYTFTLTEDRTLVANFAAVVTNNTLSLSATPAEGGTVSGGATVNAGTSVTAQATANTGYAFVNWTENGIEVSADANYTITLNEDRTLVANFRITTGIEDKIVTDIKVWPNPTTDFIHISEIPNGSSIKITSLLGQVEMQINHCEEKESLEIKNLKNGTYILSVENKKGRYSQKIVKK